MCVNRRVSRAGVSSDIKQLAIKIDNISKSPTSSAERDHPTPQIDATFGGDSATVRLLVSFWRF